MGGVLIIAGQPYYYYYADKVYSVSTVHLEYYYIKAKDIIAKGVCTIVYIINILNY